MIKLRSFCVKRFRYEMRKKRIEALPGITAAIVHAPCPTNASMHMLIRYAMRPILILCGLKPSIGL
jgi:hypothetical protein